MTLRRAPSLVLILVLACAGDPAPPPDLPAPPAGVIELDEAQRVELALEVMPVVVGEHAVPIDVAATVAAPDQSTAHVGSIVEGRLVRITVLPGQRVRAGEVLAIIHSHELASARRDLVAAEARETAARAALARSRTLLEVGAVSREEVEQREATLAAAEAELARSTDMVTHLNPDGDDVTMVAPHPGVVLAVHAKVGEAVLVGQSLVDIADVRTLWVTGWVPERAVPSLARGGPASVILAAFPGDTFAGRVMQIGGALDPVRRAVDVRVALEAPPQGLVPGMYATLILPTGDRAPRAILPAEAVQHTSEGNGVYVKETEYRYRFVPVPSARVQPDGTVAVEGLLPGTEVVTRGAFRLRAIAEIGLEDAHDH
ncbi:MAG TPA: efflux RND transporter periplasmic adaptor subunit [Gemmatimonadales bacterium]|nr:efflux RND transporter periplasmic adaptor subunit [Gemmatimonadales bacterium]